MFVLLLSFLSYPIKGASRARAEEPSYAYIPNTSVAFYSDAEEASRLLLFYLPETYFVRILGEIDGFYRVTYLDDVDGAKPLTGYVSSSLVVKVDFIPETPYLRKKIEVTYYAPGYYDGSDDLLSRYTVSCPYYGSYSEKGKDYCYVLRGDRFGYVDRPMGFTYPRNDEYEKHASFSKEPEETVADASGLSPAQIVFLVLLCLLIPTLAALVLRSPKKSVYSDDDLPE